MEGEDKKPKLFSYTSSSLDTKRGRVEARLAQATNVCPTDICYRDPSFIAEPNRIWSSTTINLLCIPLSSLRVDFHIVNQPDPSKPCGNTEDNRAPDLFYCFQTFLLHNLWVGKNIKQSQLSFSISAIDLKPGAFNKITRKLTSNS